MSGDDHKTTTEPHECETCADDWRVRRGCYDGECCRGEGVSVSGDQPREHLLFHGSIDGGAVLDGGAGAIKEGDRIRIIRDGEPDIVVRVDAISDDFRLTVSVVSR